MKYKFRYNNAATVTVSFSSVISLKPFVTDPISQNSSYYGLNCSMSVKKSKNDGDLSSDSSWTFLNPSQCSSPRSSNEDLCKPENTTKRQLEVDVSDPDVESTASSHNQKATDYNFLSIMACLLTITGMTLLTVLLPQNPSENPLENHLIQVYEHAEHPTFENAFNTIQMTRDVLKKAHASNLLDETLQNLNNDTCEAFFNSTITEPPEMHVPYYKEAKQLQNTRQSLLESAKSLIQNPRLQMFVATLVQDICLIKLITDFTKISVSKKKPSDKLTKKLNLKKKAKLFEAVTNSSQIVSDKPEENGKSECERKFEELDSRWSLLGQNHRQRIQHIKRKFLKEIDQIKLQESEGVNRKQKIRLTREKFIQKLKADREIYLHRLRKLRDEKQDSLNEMCHSFKQNRSLSSKDVSVGNFAVVLPNEYDFRKRLEEMKNKQHDNEGNKFQAINNTTISYVPPVIEENNNTLNIFNEQEFPPFIVPKRKHTSKRAKLLKKRLVQNDGKEVAEVVKNIVSSLSKTLVAKTEEEAPLLENTSTDKESLVPVVKKKKTKKTDVNRLYDAAFEKQSKKIKKQDLRKWCKNYEMDYQNSSSDPVLSKQDPQKVYKQKIIHKGLL